jgi:hypothetical protein
MLRLRHLPAHIGCVRFVRTLLIVGKGHCIKSDTWNPHARSPMHLLHRAHQAVGQVFVMGMQTNDPTPRQLAVLVAVTENEGLSQTDLVERTGIDRSTLADVVKRLKGNGLLQRRRTKERCANLCCEADGGRPSGPAHGGAAVQTGGRAHCPAGEAARSVHWRLGVGRHGAAEANLGVNGPWAQTSDH